MKTARSPQGRSLKYQQLAEHFREQVQSGKLKPGHQLPSFAQMQSEHGVGQGTLERVYSLLESEKLIVRQPKRGTFVAQTANRVGLNLIGVASGRSPREHPYYSQILQGIQEVAYRERIEVLLLHQDSAVKWERMDGVILADSSVQLPPTMPAVSLLHPMNDVSCILADECGGIRKSVDHLVTLGHRKIAFLQLPGFKPTRDFGVHRLKGYREALESAGIKPLRRWVRTLREPWEPVKGFADLGYEKMTQWLQEDWEKLGCTAILAHNDDTAIGVIRAFDQAGVRIPEDVSIMGFDGTEISEHVRPALSTVAMPLRDMGAKGMELLLRRISPDRISPDRINTDRISPADGERPSPASRPLTEILPTSLLLRASTAQAPG